MQNSGQIDLPFADGVPKTITANFELQSNAAEPQAIQNNAAGDSKQCRRRFKTEAAGD